MRYLIAVLLATMQGAALYAADQANARLIAGTVEAFNAVSEPLEGKLDVLYQPSLVFVGLKKPLNGATLTVPFDAITVIEQGDKPGPKGSTVVLATAAFGLAGFLATTQGPSDQYVTIQYREGETERTIVFLLPSKFADGIVSAIEQRSGRTRVRVTTSPSTPSRQPTPRPSAQPVAAPQPPASGPTALDDNALTNQDIIDMVKGGLSDDVVLLKVKTTRTTFDTSPQALVALRQAGVSNTVIAAMIDSAAR